LLNSKTDQKSQKNDPQLPVTKGAAGQELSSRNLSEEIHSHLRSDDSDTSYSSCSSSTHYVTDEHRSLSDIDPDHPGDVAGSGVAIKPEPISPLKQATDLESQQDKSADNQQNENQRNELSGSTSESSAKLKSVEIDSEAETVFENEDETTSVNVKLELVSPCISKQNQSTDTSKANKTNSEIKKSQATNNQQADENVEDIEKDLSQNAGLVKSPGSKKKSLKSVRTRNDQSKLFRKQDQEDTSDSDSEIEKSSPGKKEKKTQSQSSEEENSSNKKASNPETQILGSRSS